MERARTAVATSPELRRLVERGRAILLGPSDEALRQERDESHWQPAVAAGSRWWQTALGALSGVVGATVIAASAPRWRLAVPSWRLSIPGIAQPGTSTQSTMWFLLGLILFGLGWLGLENLLLVDGANGAGDLLALPRGAVAHRLVLANLLACEPILPCISPCLRAGKSPCL